LINEFDFDAAGQAAQLFQTNYLGISQGGAAPVDYAYRYVAPVNAGIASGFDFDNSGSVGGPNDAFGFGFFPGQFGMAVFSKYEILASDIRTFQNFLWKDMPGALLPDDPGTVAPNDWYSPAELDVFRLSSKSHWDVPINVNGETVHLLAAHPTSPVFDGPEDRNGTRNHDEIRFWADYVTPGSGAYIYDDDGVFGGLAANERFVIAGDLNADPNDEIGITGAMNQLLSSPLIDITQVPSSPGGTEQAALQGGANLSHTGDPAHDTADFSDSFPGNLRVDYILPSTAGLVTIDSGVFWPESSDPLFALVGTFPFPGSDHRLVYADLSVLAPATVPEPATSALLALGLFGAAYVKRRRFH
jgi:3-phytase/alkaline phosphatase D